MTIHIHMRTVRTRLRLHDIKHDSGTSISLKLETCQWIVQHLKAVCESGSLNLWRLTLKRHAPAKDERDLAKGGWLARDCPVPWQPSEFKAWRFYPGNGGNDNGGRSQFAHRLWGEAEVGWQGLLVRRSEMHFGSCQDHQRSALAHRWTGLLVTWVMCPQILRNCRCRWHPHHFRTSCSRTASLSMTSCVLWPRPLVWWRSLQLGTSKSELCIQLPYGIPVFSLRMMWSNYVFRIALNHSKSKYCTCCPRYPTCSRAACARQEHICWLRSACMQWNLTVGRRYHAMQ